MPRRYYKRQGPLKPLVENIGARLSRADSRIRRGVVKYSLIAFGGFVIYSFLAGPYGFFRISRLEDRREELIQQNRQLLAQLVDADQERWRLQYDAHYLEYIARTRYLMARPPSRKSPGETVIRITK